MKKYPVTAFLSAMLLVSVLFFAFKANEPKKEYATIQYHETYKKDAIIVTKSGESKSISALAFNDEKKFLEVLNGLAAEGWTVTTTDYASTGAYTKRVVYLERIKVESSNENSSGQN